jgi:hypothetical protein
MTPTGDPYDMELATAALLADSHDIQVMLRTLVHQLTAAFGERVKVDRKGGLLRRSEDVRRIEVALDPDVYVIDADRGTVACSVAHSSGGIRIRSETLALEAWLRRLLAGLQREAAHNQSARLALESLLSGGSV